MALKVKIIEKAREYVVAFGASIILLTCSGVADAQQSVGLVLSGGGAKGIAHIGVIQALEDNDIPIDYIAGTSMGAIVGGFYASGYTPAEMMQLIESKGFHYWSTGEIDPSLVYYYAKDDPTPRLATVNVNLGDSAATKSILPSSIINPLPMNFEFMNLFAAYSAQCGDDFDRLFVPFRCVTSDVYNKHKIVCRSGSLGDAIRASMSFPIVFEPIEMDGVLVYDGGIYDNFPVDVMREDFAPDIMIGVDVSSPDSKPNINDLFSQVEDMIIQNNDYSLPADEGIKLRIHLEEFSLLDFEACRTIYKIGYDHAMSMMDSIKSRVTARVPSEARKLRRAVFKSKTPYVEFDSVTVHGATPSQNAFIKYMFTNGRTDTFGLAQAKDAYYRAISPGKLRNLVPHAELNDSTGTFTLDLRADIKNNFNVGVGGYISSSTNSMLFLSAGYNTLSFNSLNSDINGWVGQNYLAGALNLRLSMKSANPSYLKLQAVISRHKMYDNDRIFYDSGSTLVTSSEAFARLRYGMAAGRSGKVELDLGVGRLSSRFYKDLIVSADNRDRLTNVLGQIRLHYAYNTLNDVLYPTSGMLIRATLDGVYGNEYYYPLNDNSLEVRDTKGWGEFTFRYERYWGVSRNFTMGFEGNVVASSQKLHDNYAATMVMLPAFHPTASTYSVFNTALSAPQYVTLGLQPIWTISQMFQVRGEFHGFMPWRRVKGGKAGVPPHYGDWFSDPAFFGEVAAIYSLPFAHLTAYANYCNNPGTKWNFGLSFGLFFLAPTFMH